MTSNTSFKNSVYLMLLSQYSKISGCKSLHSPNKLSLYRYRLQKLDATHHSEIEQLFSKTAFDSIPQKYNSTVMSFYNTISTTSLAIEKMPETAVLSELRKATLESMRAGTCPPQLFDDSGR